jgi:hypothetical protein
MWKLSILGLAVSTVLAASSLAMAADEGVDVLDLGAPATDSMPVGVHPGLEAIATDPLGATPFWTYSGNSGERYYSIAVSQQGNLTRFTSPAGVQHLWWEGYNVCTTNPAGATAIAYEFGGEWSGNGGGVLWGAPIVTSTSPLTIVRSSTDSRVQLTQKYAVDKTELDVTVTMTLKNISGQALSNVRLERFAHVDADNDWFDDWASRSPIKAYIFEGRGLALDALSTTGAVTSYVLGGSTSPNTCSSVSLATPVGAGDRDVKVQYNFGTLNSGASKTVKFRYSRL